MSAKRTIAGFIASLALLSLRSLLPSCTFAQAFLPQKGEGNFSISYQNLLLRDHFDSSGARSDVGHIQIHSMLQDLDYGLTSKVAVRLSLPWIISKYDGSATNYRFAHVNAQHTDDGYYHNTLQDFRLSVRYNLRARPFSVTPIIEAAIPSHHYEQFAHSTPGFDLWEMRLGVSVGRAGLGSLLPKAYFQAAYKYAIVQKHLDIRPNRSIVSSQFGYFITRRLNLSAVETLQLTHSGLGFDFVDFPASIRFEVPPSEKWYRHAQISKNSFLNLGFEVGFAVTPSVDVSGAYVTDVWGINGHALNRGLVFGVNYNFRTRRYENRPLSAQACDIYCRKCQQVFREEPNAVNQMLGRR
jgi:hypothetical protein